MFLTCSSAVLLANKLSSESFRMSGNYALGVPTTRGLFRGKVKGAPSEERSLTFELKSGRDLVYHFRPWSLEASGLTRASVARRISFNVGRLEASAVVTCEVSGDSQCLEHLYVTDENFEAAWGPFLEKSQEVISPELTYQVKDEFEKTENEEGKTVFHLTHPHKVHFAAKSSASSSTGTGGDHTSLFDDFVITSAHKKGAPMQTYTGWAEDPPRSDSKEDDSAV